MKAAADNPAVTVLMPVYNGEEHLGEAIDSILGQTFQDFELLAMDDGSMDRSRAIIRSYGDSRIRLVENEKNIGQTATLNRGLDLARGCWIARADQDDICLPRRLETQAAFLEKNPCFAAVGSRVIEIDRSGKVKRKLKVPTYEAQIRLRLVTENPFAHSAVMYSAEVARDLGGYDTGYYFIEDWELWSRMLAKGHRITNLPEYLIKYRRYGESSTNRYFAERRHEEIPRLIGRSLKELAGIDLTEEEVSLFYQARYLPQKISSEKVDQALELCQGIIGKLENRYSSRTERRELGHLEGFLSLHLAFAARRVGKMALARSIYGGMIRRGQSPLASILRYAATYFGGRLWSKLSGE